ncbi:unnamed protein product [Amoebophrya sp. A25]|nr:unnamed protein product [Amoebophrya sp. A25]|eukprot:GSA25T00012347001.1
MNATNATNSTPSSNATNSTNSSTSSSSSEQDATTPPPDEVDEMLHLLLWKPSDVERAHLAAHKRVIFLKHNRKVINGGRLGTTTSTSTTTTISTTTTTVSTTTVTPEWGDLAGHKSDEAVPITISVRLPEWETAPLVERPVPLAEALISAMNVYAEAVRKVQEHTKEEQAPSSFASIMHDVDGPTWSSSLTATTSFHDDRSSKRATRGSRRRGRGRRLMQEEEEEESSSSDDRSAGSRREADKLMRRADAEKQHRWQRDEVGPEEWQSALERRTRRRRSLARRRNTTSSSQTIIVPAAGKVVAMTEESAAASSNVTDENVDADSEQATTEGPSSSTTVSMSKLNPVQLPKHYNKYMRLSFRIKSGATASALVSADGTQLTSAARDLLQSEKVREFLEKRVSAAEFLSSRNSTFGTSLKSAEELITSLAADINVEPGSSSFVPTMEEASGELGAIAAIDSDASSASASSLLQVDLLQQEHAGGATEKSRRRKREQASSSTTREALLVEQTSSNMASSASRRAESASSSRAEAGSRTRSRNINGEEKVFSTDYFPFVSGLYWLFVLGFQSITVGGEMGGSFVLQEVPTTCPDKLVNLEAIAHNRRCLLDCVFLFLFCGQMALASHIFRYAAKYYWYKKPDWRPYLCYIFPYATATLRAEDEEFEQRVNEEMHIFELSLDHKYSHLQTQASAETLDEEEWAEEEWTMYEEDEVPDGVSQAIEKRAKKGKNKSTSKFNAASTTASTKNGTASSGNLPSAGFNGGSALFSGSKTTTGAEGSTTAAGGGSAVPGGLGGNSFFSSKIAKSASANQDEKEERMSSAVVGGANANPSGFFNSGFNNSALNRSGAP